MWKMTYSLVAVVLATAAMATEQPSSEEDPWLSSLQRPRPARNVRSKNWVSQAWHPESSPLTSSTDEHWSTSDNGNNAWGSQQPLSEALQFDPQGNLDEELGNAEETLLEVVRQPPRSLGSLVDLYKDMFRGLSPFVADPENQILSAKPERRSGLTVPEINQESQVLSNKPERRSGRRPAACRFGPFGLVCWNAARRGAVMRQRSAQYSQ